MFRWSSQCRISPIRSFNSTELKWWHYFGVYRSGSISLFCHAFASLNPLPFPTNDTQMSWLLRGPGVTFVPLEYLVDARFYTEGKIGDGLASVSRVRGGVPLLCAIHTRSAGNHPPGLKNLPDSRTVCQEELYLDPN